MAVEAAATAAAGTVALLLPETKTTRYEEQDRPNFERRVKELCADCEVIYANADQDPAKQQQQAEAAITQGAKVIVISAVDVASAAAIVTRAKQSDVAVIAYGRLIPDADIDYYVSIDPFKVGQQQAEVQMDAIEQDGGSRPEGRDDQRRSHRQQRQAVQGRREAGARGARRGGREELRHARLEPRQGPAGDGAVGHLARRGRLRRGVRGQRRHGRRGDRGAEGRGHRPGQRAS